MSELIVITKENAVTYFKENSLDSMIDKVEAHALNFVGDTSTKKGRDQIISKATGVRKIKVAVDTARKELNEERLRLTKLVNADGKKAKERLEKIIDKVRQPVTDWEKAEAIKEAAERVAIEKDLDEVEAHRMEDLLERERIINEREAKFKADEAERQKKIDEETAEKERIANQERIEKEAREQADAEAAQKIADAKQAVIDAEAAKVAAEAMAEQDRIDAETARVEAEKKAEENRLAAVAKAEKDTADRIAEENRKADAKKKLEKEAADRKAANRNHQKKIHREILEDIAKLGIDEKVGQELIKSIVGKRTRHMAINY